LSEEHSYQKKRSCNPRNKTLGSFFFFHFSGIKKAFHLEIMKFLLFKSMGLLWVCYVIFEDDVHYLLTYMSTMLTLDVNNVDINANNVNHFI